LIGIVPLKNVSSRFSVERVKSTTALPIEIVAKDTDTENTSRAS
jgi:Lrp/AsnC family transcriptional regulator